jgi:hypothetical protein
MAIWDRIKTSYENYQKADKSCADCGQEYATAISKELEENFNLKVENKTLLRALGKESYNQFLDVMLIPKKCRGVAGAVKDVSPHMAVRPFPEAKADKRNYDGFISEIKKQLSNQNPVGISFCAQQDFQAQSGAACSGERHAVVIMGYRKICDINNKCRDAVQIQNSWGQSWQENNSDGWVDAKTLLDRTFYEDYSMVYLLDNRKLPQGS